MVWRPLSISNFDGVAVIARNVRMLMVGALAALALGMAGFADWVAQSPLLADQDQAQAAVASVSRSVADTGLGSLFQSVRDVTKTLEALRFSARSED
jgi:hypothetical protein